MGIQSVHKAHPFFLGVAFLQDFLELLLGQQLDRGMMVSKGTVASGRNVQVARLHLYLFMV